MIFERYVDGSGGGGGVAVKLVSGRGGMVKVEAAVGRHREDAKQRWVRRGVCVKGVGRLGSLADSG